MKYKVTIEYPTGIRAKLDITEYFIQNSKTPFKLAFWPDAQGYSFTSLYNLIEKILKKRGPYTSDVRILAIEIYE